MVTTRPKVITTASAFAGEPVRREASQSLRVSNPSRPSAKRMRDAPAAQPRQLANALSVAPKLIPSSIQLPTYCLERSPSGALEVENALTPASLIPKPSD